MALSHSLNESGGALQWINDALEDHVGVILAPVRGAVAALAAALLQAKADAVVAATQAVDAGSAAVQQGVEFAQHNPEQAASIVTEAAGVPWLAPLLAGLALTIKRRRS